MTDARPALQLLQAAGYLMGRDKLKPRRVIDELRSQPLSPANDAAVETLEAGWQLKYGSPKDAVACADRAMMKVATAGEMDGQDLISLAGTRTILMASAQYVKAMAMLELGDFAEARASLAPVLQAGIPFLEVQASGAAGLIEVLCGRLRSGTRTAIRALEQAKENGLATHSATAGALLAVAIASRQRDELDEASVLLEEARRHAEPLTFIAELVVTEQAKLALAMGRRDEAHAVIALHRG
jgi:hypothetical protein